MSNKILKKRKVDPDNENSRKIKKPKKINAAAASTTKISQKCRVCLQDGKIPISSKSNPLDFPLSHYLNLICNIEITTNDTYPKHLCRPCTNALNKAITLRKTAMKTHLQLKSTNLCQSMKSSSKEKEQTKHEPHLITLSTSQKETDIGIDKINRIENPDVRSLSPLQKKDNNECQKGNEKECDTEVPILTLEQVQKFKAREIPYNQYYDKAIIDNILNYKCRICEKIYKKGSMADHLITHLPDNVSQYVCETCGKAFKKFCSLYKHRIIHKNMLPFQCKTCPYKGRSKNLLKVHINRVHKKEYNYQCTLCPKKFIDTNNLRYHIRRHGKPEYQCDTCDKAFYEIGVLRKHFESQHTDTTPEKCDTCGNLYKNRKSLLSHQIKVHKRKRIYNNRATYLKLENKGSDELENKSSSSHLRDPSQPYFPGEEISLNCY